MKFITFLVLLFGLQLLAANPPTMLDGLSCLQVKSSESLRLFRDIYPQVKLDIDWQAAFPKLDQQLRKELTAVLAAHYAFPILDDSLFRKENHGMPCKKARAIVSNIDSAVPQNYFNSWSSQNLKNSLAAIIAYNDFESMHWSSIQSISSPPIKNDLEIDGLLFKLSRAANKIQYSETETTYLKSYCGFYYLDINGILRGLQKGSVLFSDEAAVKAIANIDSSMKKTPRFNRNFVVYRGGYYLDPGSDQVGSDFWDKAYHSTSLSPTVAANVTPPPGNKMQIIDIITITPQTRFVFVPSVIEQKTNNELEVLIERNSHFQVIEQPIVVNGVMYRKLQILH